MPRLLRIATTIVAVGLGIVLSAPLYAQHGHSRAYVSGPRVGVVVGVPLYPPYYYPGYYYPYAPYPPTVYVAPADPPVYVQRSDIQGAPSSDPAALPPEAYWYYCKDSNAYYPHVTSCVSPWQRVLPQPLTTPQ